MGLPTIADDIEFTDDLRREALNASTPSHCDSDMGRTAEDATEDAKVGAIAELVAERAIAGTDDLSYEESDDPKVDGYVNGLPIEVKARKFWAFHGHPDLLVRKKFGLAAEYYIQIDIHLEDGDDELESDLSNVSKVDIVGVASKRDVENYGEAFLANRDEKENPTDLVPREKLRPFHEFHARVA